MSQVVGSELQLEAVRRGVPKWHGHHAGVVDQQVDRATGGHHPIRESCDRGQ
jgi:hypothetical protein